MRVLLTNHHTGRERTFDGSPEEVERDLLDTFPMFIPQVAEDRGDIEGLVELIDSLQGYTAEIEGSSGLQKSEPDAGDAGIDPDHPVIMAMLGVHAEAEEAHGAAAFLSGYPDLPEGHLRRHLWRHDDDHHAAALAAHGLEPTPQNLASLKAVMEMLKPKNSLKKSEHGMFSSQNVAPKQDVQAATPEGRPAAEAVARAFSDRFVFPIKLSGKHAEGSLLAKDEQSGNVYLLKPGSGQQSPAAGAGEQPASQSQREAGFWHAADLMGLGGWLPHADLLIIDGKQFAAMELLPWSYETLEAKKKDDPQIAQRLFTPHLREGVLHRWAVMDYVLGQPDRHANNVMVGENNEVRLIDQGSALAGKDFDPAEDENSFVPCYLRAWAPDKFHSLSPEERFKQLPRVAAQVAMALKEWLDGLHGDELAQVLHRYGADPAAILDRLAEIKNAALENPVDEAINRLWAGG